MKAMRWHGQRDLRIESIPDPEIEAPDDVIIEVSAVGLCGTDLHEYQHGPNMIRTGPHPLTGVAPPLTLGHEFSGTVAATGPAAGDLRTGQFVTVDPCLRCGRCPACVRGDYHLCAVGGSVGLASHGAFATYVRVPRINVIPVPEGVDALQAAVAEPLAVGFHAAHRAEISVGQNVLITGAGPIGIAALLGALAHGAGNVYMSEPSPYRAEIARSLGATEVFDPRADDVRKEVYLRTGRVGPDAAIEATGRSDAFDVVLRSLRRGGALSMAGISHTDCVFDLRQVVLYERRISGSLGYHHDIERVLSMMAAGRLDASAFTSEVVSLDEAPRVIKQLTADREGKLKVLVIP